MSEMSYMEKLLDGVEAAGAGGRVLRQNIRADRGHPPCDRIMMDGFVLRGDAADITDAFNEAIANKPENHSFADDFQVQRPMTAIGG